MYLFKFLGFAPPSTDALSTRLPSLMVHGFWVGTCLFIGIAPTRAFTQQLLATNHPSRLYRPQGLNFPAEYIQTVGLTLFSRLDLRATLRMIFLIGAGVFTTCSCGEDLHPPHTKLFKRKEIIYFVYILYNIFL